MAEMFAPEAAPIASDERLTGSRADRLKKLRNWLSDLPAQMWLERQPSIAAAYRSFLRIGSRKDSAPGYCHDLSEFRFWSLAAQAARMSRSKHFDGGAPLPPDAGQRRKAAQAATELLRLAERTTLLKSSGVDWKDRGGLISALKQIERHDAVSRRERVDAFSAEREFIDLLALIAWYKFADASPAIICELAALKVRNPDKTAITRRVADWKRGRPPPEHVGI